MRSAPIALAFALIYTVPAAAQADAWWGHVTTLAHDSMRGRETGSPEHRKAAEYVAGAFERARLKPAGTDGWFQPVRFVVRRIAEDRSSIALFRNGTVQAVEFGEEAIINLRSSAAGSVDAPLVFAGYGLHAPEHGLTDFSELDVRGKVVVVLSGVAPTGIPGPALALARAAGGKAIVEGGAVGVVTIRSPHSDLPWSRYAASRFESEMRLAGDSTAPGPALLAIAFSPERAERLFAGSGRQYASIQALADSGAPLPRVELVGRLRATATVLEDSAVSDNVVGVLPGSDPAAKDQYVVLTAHLDHLGVGLPVNGDSIFNGAMDNASGIATLIETAAALGRGKPRPRRPVLFVAVTAEEKGLLGSDYFAGHPSVPGTIVANLNTDMYLPLSPLRRVIVNGLEESDLADDVRRAAGRNRVEVITDPEPERNGFVRSDQFSFIRRGIPALSLKVGFTRDSPEHERVLAWRRERYHGVEDEVDQPVDRKAAADFNRLYAQVVTEIANRRSRPAWYPTSAFRPKEAGQRGGGAAGQ